MANLQLSDGLRDFLIDGGSFKQAFSGGVLKIYDATQPATANAAITGAELVEITDNSGSHTAEVAGAGSVQLTAGASGSVDTITVSGIEVLGVSVAFDTSLNQTASNVADQINLNPANYLVKASVSTDTVTLTSKPGMGALLNGDIVAGTETTITVVKVNMGTAVSGVNSANGLLFEQDPTAGVLEKLASQAWTGVAGVTSTATHFRLYGAITDAGGLDSSAVFLRLDGDVSTSGADLNFGSVAFVNTETQSIPTFSVTEPAS